MSAANKGQRPRQALQGVDYIFMEPPYEFATLKAVILPSLRCIHAAMLARCSEFGFASYFAVGPRSRTDSLAALIGC
jgi:hypothetical protein